MISHNFEVSREGRFLLSLGLQSHPNIEKDCILDKDDNAGNHQHSNQKDEEDILPERRTFGALEGTVPDVVGVTLSAQNPAVASLASSCW